MTIYYVMHRVYLNEKMHSKTKERKLEYFVRLSIMLIKFISKS
jgi:hypothetical protein